MLHNDYKLLNNFITGDEESGKQLYSVIEKGVRNFIWQETRTSILTEQDKEDIYEDTLMQSIEPKTALKYNGTTSFYVFVVGIAKNKIREKYREVQKSQKMTISTEVAEDLCDIYTRDPVWAVIEKEEIEQRKKDINRAVNLLEELKEEHQQVIKMKLFNQVSTKRISEITGESANNIDCRYRYAIKSLRKKFKKV